MEIHKPKPWHGAREFLKEYAIIVLGVLTALGAEAVVEQLHGRRTAAEAEADLAAGLRSNLRSAVVWASQRGCDQGRLSELSQGLQSASVAWRGSSEGFVDSIGAAPRVTPNVLISPNPLWTHDAWDAALASGALNHMPRERVTRYGGAYRMVDLVRTWQIQAVMLSQQLAPLAYDGEVTRTERANYLGVLAQIETLQNGAATDVRYLFQQANALGVGLSQAEVDDQVARVRKRRGACVTDVKLPIR